MSRRLASVALVAAALAAAFLLGRESAGVHEGRFVRVVEAPIGGLAEPAREAPPELAEAPLRSAILLVGDGLGVGQAAAAGFRAFGPGGRFGFELLPVAGLVETGPARGGVTKSDAAATALASGVKTLNGRLGTAPDGTRLPSLLEAARAAGLPAGLVTTSAIYDATPAAFVAHVERRRDYPTIVEQLAGSGVELLAGGGVEWFLPRAAGGVRDDGRDLLAEARARGIEVATDPAGLAAAASLPLWAIFPGKRLGESPARPDLAELAERAIALLDAEARRRGTGYFLLIEEEGIDTHGHAGDLEAMTQALLRFDAAVAVAVRHAARDGSTLVLVTSDHPTGGPTVDETTDARVLRVVWATEDHTGERVPIHAYGPPAAAARFGGALDNTDVPRRLAEALGLGLGAP